MLTQKEIIIDDYNYELPDDKIAFFPKAERDTSQLLIYNISNKQITDSTFDKLTDFLSSDMILIFNNSKVIHARLPVQNATGAAIEIFCLEPLAPTTELSNALAATGKVTWKCLVGNAKRWKTPISIPVTVNQKAIVVTATKGERTDDAFQVVFTWEATDISFAEWVEAYGKMPLPPYIKRTADKSDEQRYQTVYAQYDGSVAAPTAGLHFSQKLMENIKNKGITLDYVTLHVGAGTFKPVTCHEIGDHFMHNEQIVIYYDFIKRIIHHFDKKIIAVGTTVARTLESIYLIGSKLLLNEADPFHISQWEYYENSKLQDINPADALQTLCNYMKNNSLEYITATTQLMIVPSYQHKILNGIITNFHQPKSTLLLLVASLLGEEWHSIYAHALTHNYRFLSYGDANFYYK